MPTSLLKAKLEAKINLAQKKVKDFLDIHKDDHIGEEVQVQQIFQGMRGITGILWETSLLDAEEGIRFRGYSINELKEKLPRPYNNEEPLPEALFYLMLMGELPTDNDVELVRKLWVRKPDIPEYVYHIIDCYPADAHPMTIFSTAITAMQPKSLFAKAYQNGIHKSSYWKFVFEDAMNLITNLPYIVAYIYCKKYRNKKPLAPNLALDWSANFVHMLGYEDVPSFKAFMRLYLTLHADHEGGNVSAHTSRLVGSALSDPYLCFASSMNGLAGPLHGLATQEAIKWVLELQQNIGKKQPSKEEIEAYIHKTIKEGKVLPGYGHAVLRKTDPRFTALMEFAKQYITDDPTIQTIWNVYEVAPKILEGLGKIKNPWPNVDAHSGAILIHYGMKEHEFYTVLFGLSRAIGVLASLVWDRALNLPIERPKSITFEALERSVKKK